VWAVFLWRSYSGFLPWALWIAVAVGAMAIAVMIWARISRVTALRVATVALIAGVAAMLIPGSAWAASVLDSKYAGSSFNAGAGPDSGMGGGQGGGARMSGDGGESSAAKGSGSRMGDGAFGQFPGGAPGGASGGAPSGSSGAAPSGSSGEAGSGTSPGGFGNMMSGSDTLSTEEQKIYNYVSANRGGASYLMAVSSWTEAGPYIMATGQEIMPMGGFSGSVSSPTLAQAQKLVSSGQLKFFLVNSGTGRSGNGSSTVSAIDSWVKKTCTEVPAKDYGGTTSPTSNSASRTSTGGTSTGGTSSASALPGGSSAAQVLYECKG
jgi:hypothetical protein